jgi:hypothetical protein
MMASKFNTENLMKFLRYRLQNSFLTRVQVTGVQAKEVSTTVESTSKNNYATPYTSDSQPGCHEEVSGVAPNI